MGRTIDVWDGCYPSNWRGMIVPEAINHPAKYSSKLIRNIYDHILSEGWVKKGDSVIDPFGGVALGALDAMRAGLRWRGIELEANFADIGNKNIGLWNSKFSSMPKWERDALLVNGDSQKLIELLGIDADISICSPPFRQSSGGAGQPKYTTGSMADPGIIKRHAAGNGTSKSYGDTEGNLANMPEGDFDQIISSPPYADSLRPTERGSGFDYSKVKSARGQVKSPGREAIAKGYGKSDGNLASMPSGNFDQSISSPPYAETRITEPGKYMNSFGRKSSQEVKYGELYKETMGDFWGAARTIVGQTYLALRPGGHACWVVKDFVKKGEIVPFCDQWRQLCEAVGFITLHEHHAMLVRKQGATMTMEGNRHEHVKSSKSFFRRVAESHGSPEINWETVFCMVKGE